MEQVGMRSITPQLQPNNSHSLNPWNISEDFKIK